jgi:hypothetical protein
MQHIDLNLLMTLDALLSEESVQGAADQMRITPPAMSTHWHGYARSSVIRFW